MSHNQLNRWKKVIMLALPMAGSQFINIGSGFLCMAMLATLGHEVLAASALIFTTQLSVMVSGMSILFSLSVLISHAYGANDNETIGNYVQQGWVLALIISLPIMLLFWHIDKIFIYLKEPIGIIHIIHDYFHAYLFAVIPALLATCNMQFGYGIHKKKLIICSSFLSVLILLGVAYALIFGKFGLPKLGVTGLPYAITAQFLFFVSFTTGFFYIERSFKKFKLFHYRVNYTSLHFFTLIQVGWPISVQMGGEMISFFVSGIMIGWLGMTALSAFQIINQYYFLILIPIFSLSQASSILVGHAVGAKQLAEVKTLSYTSIHMGICISLLVGLIFFFFAKSLAAFYINIENPDNFAVLHLTVILFSILAFSQAFDALRNILVGILRGLLDTRFSMMMSLITIWLVGMPLSYLLAFTFKLGAIGFVIGGMLGMLSGLILMGWRFYTHYTSNSVMGVCS